MNGWSPSRKWKQSAVAWLFLTAAVAWGSPGVAAESERTSTQSARGSNWEDTLRNAGASPAELAKFEESLRNKSPVEIAKAEEFLQRASTADLAKLLDDMRIAAREQALHPTLKIGASLPDFVLKGVDGKIHTHADYSRSSVLVVMFISNHCPTSQLYEGRIKKLVADYATKRVAFVAIQPNNPKASAPSEMGYTDVDDSFEGMVVRAAHRNFTFPYLYDGDDQAVSKKFGPKATPHIFIFDENRKLRFEGRIDDNLRERQARTHEARDAIDALLAGRSVAVENTSVFGCSTKWNGRTESIAREAREWQSKPVTVETVTVGGLKQLRGNPTGKMLMINFWATWCGPCRTEYPDLLTTYRWYGDRDFDFISISFDSPASRADVLRFLGKVHSPIRNLQIDSEDVYAIQSAFDPMWKSGVPFTIVLAPDGKAIYRSEGEVDVLALRRAILANFTDNGFYAGHADYWKH